ncbi:hypothetical protein HY484_04775 [Candidatus Woesearchaeota archaeon]|nr:hypothetical protein [Candidatus Woesearchaeota archaeon]
MRTNPRAITQVKLFENESFGGILTYKASEQILAKNWLTKEEDNAWVHLQGTCFSNK